MLLSRRSIIAVGLSAGFGVVACARGQDSENKDTESKETRRNEKLLSVCKSDLGEYKFEITKPTPSSDIKHIPVMNWTNPVRDQVQIGYLGMWLSAGKPVAIGTAFCFPSPRAEEPGYMFVHEFHTLTLSSISVTRDGKDFWESKEVAYKPGTFDNAELPGKSPTQRLRQMRMLAERFSAHSIDSKNQKYVLRLLPKPLYRYESPEGDGAIFAMVSDAGTDPEVLLVIETEAIGPEGQWRHGVIRYSDLNLFVSLDKQQIWSFENGGVWPIRDCGPAHRYRLHEDRIIPTPDEKTPTSGGSGDKKTEKSKSVQPKN
jgi:hypothetical protein